MLNKCHLVDLSEYGHPVYCGIRKVPKGEGTVGSRFVQNHIDGRVLKSKFESARQFVEQLCPDCMAASTLNLDLSALQDQSYYSLGE